MVPEFCTAVLFWWPECTVCEWSWSGVFLVAKVYCAHGPGVVLLLWFVWLECAGCMVLEWCDSVLFLMEKVYCAHGPGVVCWVHGPGVV